MTLSPKDFEELYLVFRYLTGDKCYQNNTVKKIVDLAAQEMDYSEVHSAYIYFNEYEIKDLEAIYDNAVDDCSTIVEDEKELLN